ncbi:hypothetical protein GDO78_015653 [Eleutherodactylus coqui]|uniref:Uncharacterized protein n=1 Tax=Eleutherodactylus coqui TaxID=57060 RepID=A0A8J6EDJ7_ELECQ|nr:hypothetical protein GDO78_015653 [Eleutherodactylus coqui]
MAATHLTKVRAELSKRWKSRVTQGGFAAVLPRIAVAYPHCGKTAVFAVQCSTKEICQKAVLTGWIFSAQPQCGNATASQF